MIRFYPCLLLLEIECEKLGTKKRIVTFYGIYPLLEVRILWQRDDRYRGTFSGTKFVKKKRVRVRLTYSERWVVSVVSIQKRKEISLIQKFRVAMNSRCSLLASKSYRLVSFACSN